MAIGAIFGSIISGYMIDQVGRKTTILLTSLFYTPGWCLICYAKGVYMLYFGRFLTGIAVGMASLAVPVSMHRVRNNGGYHCGERLFRVFSAQ